MKAKKVITIENNCTELLDEQTERIGERKGLSVMDKDAQQCGGATEVKSSDEVLNNKDFPEDNAPKKQIAKALGNLKNSTLPSTKEESSEKKFLEKKTQRTEKEKNQSKTKESKKGKKNFSFAKKGDNKTKDKSIQRKETNYYLKEMEEIIFPEVTEPTTNELMIFFKYEKELLNKILKENGVLTRLSRKKIKTLFELLPFEMFKERSLSYIFSYMRPNNKITIRNGIEIEESNGKSCFKYLMNLTFEEAYANYLHDCNVYLNENKIYILQP